MRIKNLLSEHFHMSIDSLTAHFTKENLKIPICIERKEEMERRTSSTIQYALLKTKLIVEP